MIDEAVREIVSSGILGALLCVLGWRYHVQSVELGKVQEARVKDALKVAETHLAIQDQQRWVISELTEAVKRLRPPEDEGPPTKPTRRST